MIKQFKNELTNLKTTLDETDKLDIIRQQQLIEIGEVAYKIEELKTKKLMY